MGNITTRPSNKINILSEEVKDISFNISNKVLQQASQTIVAIQDQKIEVEIQQIKNCNINISQKLEVEAKQIASFKNFITNPRDIIKSLTQGPNSLFEQAVNSPSPVMKGFVNDLKGTLGAANDADLKVKVTNIFKTNISSTSVQQCSQDIFTSQTQRIKIISKLCQDSKINIVQNAIVSASQNCLFEVSTNALAKDPKFRSAIRKFNGDYDKGLDDLTMDNGASIPEACFNDERTIVKQSQCPECSPCSAATMSINYNVVYITIIVMLILIILKDFIFEL